MNKKKDEKWLDELISQTINSEKPEFDSEKWKEKHPEELQVLLSWARQASSVRQRRLRTMIYKSSVSKLAAAAAIIVVIGLLIVHRGTPEHIDGRTASKVAKSPADMLTAMSLNIAYRRGGMEAVDAQCEKAFKMLGPRPTSISMRELLAEFNGS